MNAQLLTIVIGGILPALFFGLAGFLIKVSMVKGIGVGAYLFIFALAEGAAALVFYALLPGSARAVTFQGVAYTALGGMMRAVGAGLVAYALVTYVAPISKLAPLYNANTLITVLLGLFFFTEWKHVNSPKLLLGAILIVVGSILVADS